MGAGLSMASVNKIKELANSREYSLALELVEHQDLTKSLNPQFLRLCGEIYIKNDKYEDARRCLIMAHRLGPESKRILYTFVELYLRMGYFQLAKTYYDMYMFDANAYDSRDMEYVWNKHEHADDYKLLEPLIGGYAHNLDYDWSFELYLLYKKEGKQNEADALAELYHASFKNSENSQIILDIEAGKAKVDTYYNIYADTEAADDSPDMEALRTEEQELLATDDLRMHPKEAEITIMYEDSYAPAGSEKKVQKMLKKQEREEQRKEKKLFKKQKQQEKAEAVATAEAEEKATAEAEVKRDTEAKSEPDPKVPETVADETEQKVTVEASGAETEKETKKGFFQRWKKKKQEEESEEVVSDDEEVVEKKETPAPETTENEEEKKEPGTTDIEDTKETTSESKDAKALEEPKESNSDISSEIAETTGQAEDMRHRKGTIAKDVVVVDEDDGFEAEADTIEELAEKEHGTQVPEMKEAEVTNGKPAFEFQTLELAPEDFEEEYEVDDFSEKLDAEFGEMKMPEPKPEIEVEVEEPEAVEPEMETESEPETEETLEEAVEEEPEIEVEIEEPETVESEPEMETEPEPEIEETVEEAVEEEPKIEIEVEEPEAVESEPEMETEPEPEIEETVEEAVEEEPEIEIEVEESEIVEPELEMETEPEPEIEETVEEAVEEEPEIEVEIEEPEAVEPKPEMETEPEPEIEETVEEAKEEFHVAPFTTKPEKKKLDFPVFKSSLFPDYHKETKIVENNFNVIMEEAQDKMTENMRKEEQMQREAEALLASLGISMDAISTTPEAEKREEQPVQKGPSRDELKASLKIDSVKKNLLKRVKEYR